MEDVFYVRGNPLTLVIGVVPTRPGTEPYYPICVSQPARGRSGFLQTHPHGYALAFGSYFW
jgi:hypothetical protein